ncbi:unnamed protein product [Symbiodinium sp. CCMP2592]|nr:unnamed protein product [Symbiodinium sp. CCMP2592]
MARKRRCAEDASPEAGRRGRRHVGLGAVILENLGYSGNDDEGQEAKAAKLDAFAAPEGAERASPDEAPRKRRPRKEKRLPEGADAASGDEAPRKRRPRKPRAPDAEEEQSQGDRGAAPKGQRRAQRTKAAEFGEEEEPDEASVVAWKRLLAARAEGEDWRLAFSLRPMLPQELRQLGPESFLGKKKELGAQPLFNREGKVNLQFLLASYKASEKRRSEDKDASNPHHPFLLWLVKQARQLRLLSSREVKRGQIPKHRLEQAKTNGYSLADGANLAQASDDEERNRQKEAEQERLEKQASADILHREVPFPEREQVGSQSLAESSERLRQQLRNQAELRKASGLACAVLRVSVHDFVKAYKEDNRDSRRMDMPHRQEKIKAHSSNGQDLQSMSSVLSAPSLSFDWVEPESDEENNPNGTLQVDLPPSAKSSESRRELLRETIQRSVSFKQAEVLNSKANRALSASLSASSAKSSRLAEADKLADKLAEKLKAKSKEGDAPVHPQGEGSATAAAAVTPPQGAGNSAEASGPAAETSTTADSIPAEASGPAVETSVTERCIPAVASGPAAETSATVGSLPAEASGPAVETTSAEDSIPAQGPAGEISAAEASVLEGAAGDLEISATLPFEVDLEPGAQAAPTDADISATLPFDVLLEAPANDEAGDEMQERAGQAQPPVTTEASDALLEAEDQTHTSSEEDAEDLPAAQRRERAWLRHLKQKRREEDKENQKVQKSKAKAGRGKMTSPEDEEDELFLGNRGNRQRGDRNRPNLLLGARVPRRQA